MEGLKEGVKEEVSEGEGVKEGGDGGKEGVKTKRVQEGVKEVKKKRSKDLFLLQVVECKRNSLVQIPAVFFQRLQRI